MQPGSRMIDVAKSSLQHLSDQERAISSRVRTAIDPVEEQYKPLEAPHSFTASPRKMKLSGDLSKAPNPIRMPKVLSARAPEPPDVTEPHDASAPLGIGGVRRWELMPKHAWLQAAEAGHAPGPGFRDVASTQPMRSYGPKGTLPLGAPTTGAGRGGCSGTRT